MTYILNLETATKNCSVSLSKNGDVILYKEIAEQGFTHAEKLHLFIDEILKEANVEISKINAVAVSKGPGSYTGLRIGVSAAKGICYALGIPLISVDTLKSLASQVEVKNGLVVPMLDARRMEVYSSVFNSNYKNIREIRAEIIDESSFSEYNETIYFIGDANEKCKSVLKKDNFVFLDNVIYPSAKEMGKMSYEKYKKNEFEDLAYFEPFYLKDFIVTQSKK